MLAKSNLWVMSVGVALIAMGAAAQTPVPCTVPVALGALTYGEIPKVGAPYTATVTTTREQKQADGTSIRSSVTTHQGRDAAGRTWEERSLGCQRGADGALHPVVKILVYDPATRANISWTVDDPAKVYRVVRDPARTPLPPATTDPGQDAAARRAMEELGIHIEDIGSKSVAGVMAVGTRTVNTGTVNVTDETWVTKDLDLAMLKVEDNSRVGRTTIEVVDLKQGEPDHARFAPPTDYKILDTKPAQ